MRGLEVTERSLARRQTLTILAGLRGLLGLRPEGLETLAPLVRAAQAAQGVVVAQADTLTWKQTLPAALTTPTPLLAEAVLEVAVVLPELLAGLDLLELLGTPEITGRSATPETRGRAQHRGTPAVRHQLHGPVRLAVQVSRGQTLPRLPIPTPTLTSVRTSL